MRGLSRDSGVRLGWTLALTSLAFFKVGLDALVVVTALPVIHRDPGASLDSLQWTVNTYSPAWAASFVWFASLASASVEYWRLAIPMALTGIGVAVVLPVPPTAELSAVERADLVFVRLSRSSRGWR